MGILCEINLFKSSYGACLPGQVVSGLIRYVVDAPIEFEKITISLKGRGFIYSEFGHYGHKYRHFLRSSQNYIDIDNITQESKIVVPVGTHEIPYSFKIPYNVPSTVNIYKYLVLCDCIVKCRIKYYIRIKFKRPGIFVRNIHFTKDIIIHSLTPRLPRNPVIYEETKKLMRLFSSKHSYINIKATILKSVIPIGDKIGLHYEVENNSNILVKSIETKIIEMCKFKATEYYEMRNEEIVPDTNAISSSINCGDTQVIAIEVNIPPDLYSLDHAKIVTRDYFLRIEAALPIPHRNIVLNIPIQIGAIDENMNILEEKAECITVTNSQPFHWDVMTETKKTNESGSLGTV